MEATPKQFSKQIMKTFKTMKGMEMTANRLMSAINERFKEYSEPVSVEINRSTGKCIEIEVANRNTFSLTMIEVDVLRQEVNSLLKDYSTDDWFIKFDTTPIYNPTTESFFHIPTMVIELILNK